MCVCVCVGVGVITSSVIYTEVGKVRHQNGGQGIEEADKGRETELQTKRQRTQDLELYVQFPFHQERVATASGLRFYFHSLSLCVWVCWVVLSQSVDLVIQCSNCFLSRARLLLELRASGVLVAPNLWLGEWGEWGVPGVWGARGNGEGGVVLLKLIVEGPGDLLNTSSRRKTGARGH